MTKLYSTTSPQGIIDLFERQAKDAEDRTKAATTKTRIEALKTEMYTWRAAADILRNTEFVGWNVGMVVDDVRKD